MGVFSSQGRLKLTDPHKIADFSFRGVRHMINVFKEDIILGEPELVVLVYSKFKKRVGRTK